ncbi:hypothetical protein BC829DRAFT_443389 [Chytridium lagenaria]|nr:hypothetical protein BC829DRAFT_443389 [Chytridium lagenaria]
MKAPKKAPEIPGRSSSKGLVKETDEMVPSIEMPIQRLDRHQDQQVDSNALVLATSLPVICEEPPRPTEEACPYPPPSLEAGNLDTLSRSSLTPFELEIIMSIPKPEEVDGNFDSTAASVTLKKGFNVPERSSSKDVNNIEAFDLNILSSNIPNLCF